MTVDGSSVTETADDSRSSPTVRAPPVTATVPRTFEMPAWRTVKDASVCEGSMFQVPVVRPAGRADMGSSEGIDENR